ncbi:MAG: NTP transferase domain-containing protein [Thaumarchaeota archaeon]|nr:NTP transferase domain-containing protein [Nitrososphaerota archaeon]
MSNRSAVVLVTGKEDVEIPTQFSEPGSTESSLIEYVLNSVWTVVDQIFVVFNHEPDLSIVEAIAPFGVKIIVDENSNNGNILSSMKIGMEASRSELCFVMMGNTPFIKPNVIFALFEGARGFDAAIPKRPDGSVNPLLAVYRTKSFLRALETNKDAATPQDVVDWLNAIRFIDVEKEIKPLDPDLNSLFQINTEEDVRKARNIASTLMRR